MNLPEYFISCDWGTTNFRLKLVETNSLKVIEEINSKNGIKALHQKFLQQNDLSQFRFFSDFLTSQIKLLPRGHQNHIVVSSGMATSNIGLCELDYANMPFDGTGKNLISKKIYTKDNNEVILVSGVKNNSGVMRGEETQAIGLEGRLKEFNNGILLLPGTHSKHLAYQNGAFTDLKTFMTGELFEIISQKSILSSSIIKSDKESISEASFLEGVELGAKGKLTSSLFSIRSNHISGKTSQMDNYFFLSGLLIGDELSYLKRMDYLIFLASPNPTGLLYKTALNHIVGKARCIIFDSELVEQAVLVGQKKILLSYYE